MTTGNGDFERALAEALRALDEAEGDIDAALKGHPLAESLRPHLELSKALRERRSGTTPDAQNAAREMLRRQLEERDKGGPREDQSD